jgi:hypothetical protein
MNIFSQVVQESIEKLLKELRKICRGKYNIILCDYIRSKNFQGMKAFLNTLVANGETEEKTAKEIFKYVFNNRKGAVNALTLDTGGSCAEGLISHILSERFSRTASGWGKKGVLLCCSFVHFSLTAEN